ncbi:disulfide isomerase [Acephala macrosclerotiorum]|nr:disulfide isomerase [Acephala macrosclerotiorum]
MVLLKSLLVFTGLATLSLAKGPGGSPPTYDNSAVLDLIPDNFDKIAISGKPALVEFFAPWCGHCKSLAPVYEELAQSFAFAKDKVSIAKVDADAEKTLGKRFGIQGFPTIKYFDGKSDKPEDYSGGRDIDSLTEFITKKTGVKPKKAKAAPSQVEMLSDKSFKEQIGGDKDVLVAFTAPWCGHCKSLAPIWEKVAADFTNEPNVVIAKVDAEAENSKATAQDQGVSSYPTIKFFPKGTTKPEAYEGGRTEADFVTFLNDKAGTHRTVGGGLDATAGTIEVLDALVSKFTGGSSIAEVAAEATKAAADLKKDAQYKYADYYVRVFDKLAKNDGFAAKEFARLDKLIKKGGLAPEKLDEMTSKTNILKRFVEKATGKSEL